MSRTDSTPGTHTPLGPRIAWFELMSYFSVFMGHGAVRSDFNNNFQLQNI